MEREDGMSTGIRMKEITYARALWEAFDEAMSRDERVFLMGEDIGVHGNIFGAMYGLQEKYGGKRVRSSPISEVAIVGAGVGAAALGMKPVVEIMFVDFATIAMDQIVNQAAKLHYMTGGKVKIPLVIRTQGGAGTGEAAQHSQSLEAFYAHVPGLKVVMPSTPHDAKGLLLQAIEDENPVMFIEHKLLYATRGPVQEGYYTISFGKAEVRRKGKDVTIVAYSKMVLDSLDAAEELSQKGIEAEVIDLRTLNPLDTETIITSLRKTGKLLVVHEACKTMGFGAEIMARIAEKGINVPMRRVAGEDTPIPYSRVLEERVIPNKGRIVNAAISYFD
jgi:pyruvate/2-oxoglutarate/acetoin dehydrogenase E1 component